MLSLKTGALASLALFGALAIAVGCAGSTTDDGDPVLTHSPTDPAKDGGGGKKLPAPGGGSSASSSSGSANTGDDDDDSVGGPDGGGSSSSSSSSSSSGAIDAGTDSGPAPDVGDTCSTLDQKYARVCGHCGKQEAICAQTRTGALEVTDYGPCGNESGVCSAGDVQPCGSKCGTAVCGSTCAWGTCKNEGVCKKGVIAHDSAGCPTAGTYRSKVCDDTCAFGNLSSCAAPELIVPPPGQTSLTQWQLTTAIMGKRPTSCKKTATLNTVTGFPIPLKNTGSTDATVTIWHTSTGTAVDTVLATYNTLPVTDDDFKACVTEPQDGCAIVPSSTCTADGTGSFAGVDNVKVPANSTIIIYSSGWTDTTTGGFVLNVKTKLTP